MNLDFKPEDYLNRSISLDLSNELESIIEKAKRDKNNIFSSLINYSLDSSSDLVKQNTNFHDNILLNIEDDEDNSLIKSIYSNISFKIPENIFNSKEYINLKNNNEDNEDLKTSMNNNLRDKNLKHNHLEEDFQFQIDNLKKYIYNNNNNINSEVPSFRLNTSFNYSEINNDFQKLKESQNFKTEIINNEDLIPKLYNESEHNLPKIVLIMMNITII
ncbi:hypothetical protein BCR36DRAFT_96964 [Piromyces finnis]|uniref:Uncharacterized protein n=1 Tax=Piromyces finnis TaxID=1754191 RepID=A0A1Y1V605_9FUNG|nr:hypothetical protein BCR36DRAFT_96964 [Piromyces finnis]|eukprot:ORX47364.1 hypothetical protein BCR36DRAFT_96964 [Piromyces finnis]